MGPLLIVANVEFDRYGKWPLASVREVDGAIVVCDAPAFAVRALAATS
jgi:hypothetical protein